MALNPAKVLGVLLREAKQDRKPYDEKWKRALEWLKGEQLLNKPNFKANTVTNFLFSQLMTEIPILSARIPEVALKPHTEDLKPQAEELAKVIARIFNVNDFHQRQVELITNGLIFGRSFFKTTWDTRLWGGFGDVKIESPDTRSVFLEPGKMSIQDCNYIFESRLINKLTLLRLYPDRRNAINKLFLKGEVGREIAVMSGKETGDTGYHAAAPGEAPLTTIEAYVFDVATSKPSDKAVIEFVEAWFVDESMVEDVRAMLDGQGNVITTKDGRIKKEKYLRHEFPDGRLVSFSGDEVFIDDKNPFPKFPYTEYRNYFLPGEPWSMGELEQVLSLQELYNIRQNQITDLLNTNIAPIRFFDASSGLDPTLITNRPGQWIPVSHVDGVKEFRPQPVHAATFVSLQKLQRDIETVMGVREVTQGTVPGDVRSGYAVEALQEAAQVRLRLKSRFIESAVKDLARYLTYMIGRFYIRGVHYSNDVDLEGIVPDFFDYEIKAGINLPASKFAEQQMIMWMYDRQIVDDEYIVEHAQLQGKEALMERMRPIWERKAQMLTQGATSPQQGGQ